MNREDLSNIIGILTVSRVPGIPTTAHHSTPVVPPTSRAQKLPLMALSMRPLQVSTVHQLLATSTHQLLEPGTANTRLRVRVHLLQGATPQLLEEVGMPKRPLLMMGRDTTECFVERVH